MIEPVPYVNLVPTNIRNQRQRWRVVKGWCGAVLVTACVVGVPGVYLGGNAVLSDPLMGTQIERVRNQLSTNQTEIPKLQSRIGVLDEKRQTLDLVRNRIDWQSLFGHIVYVSDEQIHFTALNASGGGVEGTDPMIIEMAGIATTQTAARSYVVELESLGLFDRVELTDTRRDDIAGHEVIEFMIVMQIGKEPVVVEQAGEQP
jgi:Tfp pilus assembly protein PilN